MTREKLMTKEDFLDDFNYAFSELNKDLDKYAAFFVEVYQVQTIWDKGGKETKVIVPYRITRVLISEYDLKIEAYTINGGYVSSILFEPAWFNQFVFKTQKEAERAAG